MKKKKMQVSFKVVFTKPFASHAIGNVIATDMGTANFLIKKGVCESYVEKKEQPKIIQKEVIETVEIPVEKVVKVEKPKGRPKGKVVKKKTSKK